MLLFFFWGGGGGGGVKSVSVKAIRATLAVCAVPLTGEYSQCPHAACRRMLLLPSSFVFLLSSESLRLALQAGDESGALFKPRIHFEV